ncbi:MAG: hypothetical protein VKJ66_11090, partial [Synechococcus sp.]|nr:hypothetical protein [Synechococcus sp.]
MKIMAATEERIRVREGDENVMAANSLGAIPFVVTMSHNINLDKIQSASEFLDRWYLQLLGDASRGAFNLGSGNTIYAAPGPGPGSGTDLTTSTCSEVGMPLRRTPRLMAHPPERLSNSVPCRRIQGSGSSDGI